MTASNARKSAGPLAVTKSAVNDIVAILAKYNPGAPKSALKVTGRAVAALSAAAGRLSREQQRQIGGSREGSRASHRGCGFRTGRGRDDQPGFDQSGRQSAGRGEPGRRLRRIAAGGGRPQARRRIR